MLSNEEMNDLLAGFDKRMEGINDHYIRLMAEHIRDIGKLTASDVDRLEAMRRVSRDMDTVVKELAEAVNDPSIDLDKVFNRTVEDGITFLNDVLGAGTIELENNIGLQNLLKAQILQTRGQLSNFSNTTVISNPYRNAVDRAINAVQSGVEDYKTAIRSTVRQNAAEGLRVLQEEQDGGRRNGEASPLVRYASGVTRRMDTAARQNVLDGVRQLSQQSMDLVGAQIGADGVEISAHILCATDHIDYQGRQFTNEEFEEIQKELDRPFGQWNCRHMWWPIFVGISEQSNSPETLKYYKDFSNEQITITAANGREITRSRYEWTQEQRRLETAIRQQKDIRTAAEIVGDETLARQCDVNIRRYDDVYKQISSEVGIEQSRRRMAGSDSAIREANGLEPRSRRTLRETENSDIMHSDVKKYIDEDGRVINADTGEIIKDVDPNAQDSDAIYVCKKSGIEYNPVMELDDKLSEDDIIARLGGGDKTKGSCSSLAFAYTGNMNGLDVLDFRGGESTYAFSTNMLIKDIANMSGVNSTILRGKREIRMVNDIAGTMQIGSHYYLAAGRHAAIVRRTEAGFQYLELQSATRNGFKPLTSGVLRDRFACTQRSTRDRSVILIDCDSLGSSDDFRRILGYINTDPSRQMKGSTGHER